MKVLKIVGAIYLLSALWCLFQPELSAMSLGFQFVSQAARVEYLTVYGGLQLGLGMAMWWVSTQPKLLLGGLFFSLVFSCVLVLMRVLGLLLITTTPMLWILCLLEAVIALALWWQWRKISERE